MRRAGGHNILKTLLDVYLLRSNFATLTFNQKKRQRERPPVMTVQSSALGRGVYCISSLTWAGCVAYPLRWQRRPDSGMSKKQDSHVFFVVWSEQGIADWSIFLNDKIIIESLGTDSIIVGYDCRFLFQAEFRGRLYANSYTSATANTYTPTDRKDCGSE